MDLKSRGHIRNGLNTSTSACKHEWKIFNHHKKNWRDLMTKNYCFKPNFTIHHSYNLTFISITVYHPRSEYYNIANFWNILYKHRNGKQHLFSKRIYWKSTVQICEKHSDMRWVDQLSEFSQTINHAKPSTFLMSTLG